MANRRMFSKTITSSSQFLMMPQSSQNLYFHLGMNADDDGFCEHFGIMRMTESKPVDLQVLHSKGFVQVFDDKVLVIKDWKTNNFLRNDRYTPSKYLEIYNQEIKQLVEHNNNEGIPVVYQRDTQVRLGKERIGKVNTITPSHISILDNKEVREKLETQFQGVNVVEEIEKMKDWAAASGKRKKDYVAFARTWLRKAPTTKISDNIT